MRHLVCFHLFNDYSGSPKVLKMVLEGLLKRGYKVDLVSSKGGVLDELSQYVNLNKYSYSYRFSDNAVTTMLRYCFVQTYTFFLSFRWIFVEETVFYINTLLPLGPALAGRIMGKRVVYHYHENAFIKGAFYKMLAKCMQCLAHEIICVSQYQASFLKRKEGVVVVPNALAQQFTDRLVYNPDAAFKRKTVLMLGSLKLYKGPLEFVQLAIRLPHFSFELVVNDTQDNIDSFITDHSIIIPSNLVIYPRQNDVIPFYNRSSVVLNLSNRNVFIETFGLTALEAMSAGLPIIVPTEGGIADMVDDGINGYKIDVRQLDKIEHRINSILTDENLYRTLAQNAFRYSQQFCEEQMMSNIEKCL